MTPSSTHPNKTPFIGRQELMDWLAGVIVSDQSGSDGSQARGPNPLVLVYGTNGIGKTTACKRFIELQLTGSKEPRPFVAFDWKGGYQVRSVLRFAQMLFEMGTSNMPRSQADQGLLVIGVTGEMASEVQKEDRGDQTYREDGLAAEDPSQMQALNDDEAKQLADEFARQLIVWIGTSVGDPSMQILGKVVFVFDEFEHYPVSVRRWVGRFLYPALSSHVAIPPCAFLFTAEMSWEHCSFVDYWDLPPGVLKEFRLDPMTSTECAIWLANKGFGEEYLETLIEETEGIPARIEELLRDPERLKALHAGADAIGPLAKFGARERRWLHAASMLERVSYESFELLLGYREAIQASDWLIQHSELCRTDLDVHDGRRSGVMMVNSDLRQMILNSSKKKIPIRHHQYLSKMKLMDEIAKQVPVLKHRRYLGMLAPVQPLNEEVIQYVFGEDR